MIQYIEDSDKKYLDDLLFHLRKHSARYVSAKTTEIYHIYALDKDKLIGAITLSFSWDWISIKTIFYDNLEVLQEMISKALKKYKGKALGINFYTSVVSRLNDFLNIGFSLKTKYEDKSKSGYCYYANITDFSIEDKQRYKIIESYESIEKYDRISNDRIKIFNEENAIDENFEEKMFVALDGDTFVGGIVIEIYKDSIYTDLLSVNSEYRGNNVGSNLMKIVDDIARSRNIDYLDVGTTEFQAKPFYEKKGYKVVLTKENCPKGYKSYTLVKRL